MRNPYFRDCATTWLLTQGAHLTQSLPLWLTECSAAYFLTASRRCKMESLETSCRQIFVNRLRSSNVANLCRKQI